jgi:transmembrane sensor
LDNKQHIPITEDLLAKYLAGEAGPEEAIAINNWLEALSENRQTFDQLAKVWENATLSSYQKPDVDREWKRFSQKQSSKKRTYTWLAVAASIVCLIAIYKLLPVGKESPEIISLHAQKDITQDTLPDNSYVVMPPGSEISYPATFTSRQIKLKGEAYFEVQASSQSPFIVETDELRIQVLGTAFNVKTTPEQIIVQVNNGAVLVSSKTSAITLREGQGCIYNRASRTFDTVSIAENGRNSYAYATRELHFQHTSLSEVAQQVSKAYNVEIRLENERAADCRISTTFENKSLSYVLDVIAASLDLQYRTEGNVIYISGDECN